MTKSFTTAWQKHSLIKSVSLPHFYTSLLLLWGFYKEKNQLARSPEITGRAVANDVSSALNMVDYGR